MSKKPTDNTAIHEYFAKLQLAPEIADIYLALHAYGPQTITSISRHANVERTRVYRLLDVMVKANLVETETHYKRTIIRAAPIMNLQILLTEREQEVRNLQTELEFIHRKLNEHSMESPLTRVQFYRGPEGTKQMFWNQTKATTDTRSILYETMQSKTNLTFFERWARKCNENKLQFRGIIGDNFLDDLKGWYKQHDNERLEYWDSRYISPSIFPITHSTITYNDVVAYYNWKDGEVFGVEIYNKEIAATQRRVFELLWRQGQAVTNDLQWNPPGSSEQ